MIPLPVQLVGRYARILQTDDGDDQFSILSKQQCVQSVVESQHRQVSYNDPVVRHSHVPAERFSLLKSIPLGLDHCIYMDGLGSRLQVLEQDARTLAAGSYYTTIPLHDGHFVYGGGVSTVYTSSWGVECQKRGRAAVRLRNCSFPDHITAGNKL